MEKVLKFHLLKLLLLTLLRRPVASEIESKWPVTGENSAVELCGPSPRRRRIKEVVLVAVPVDTTDAPGLVVALVNSIPISSHTGCNRQSWGFYGGASRPHPRRRRPVITTATRQTAIPPRRPTCPQLPGITTTTDLQLPSWIAIQSRFVSSLPQQSKGEITRWFI